MTLKRRMITTNILMLAVPTVLCMIVAFLQRVIFYYILEGRGLPLPNKETEYFDVEPWMYLYFLGQMALIAGIFFVSNMFFIRRLIGQIMAEHAKYEKNRRELIAGISHDLRTPLTSIKAYLEGLETGVASTPEKRQQYFATIKSKTHDLEHIISQLFLFSKLDIGDYPLSMQHIDIGRTVTDMLGELADEYGRRGLAIEVAPIVESIFVNADYLRLRNVIINILENSVKYKAAANGTLRVNCGIIGDNAEITLTDDGPGVPPEALDKLFDVFYRADPARTNEKKGSGLGLAIAEKTIRHMGGTIHAELPVKGGLAIVIRLPRVAA